MNSVLRFNLWLFSVGVTGCFLIVTAVRPLSAADQPLVPVAHGAFNEKILALWIGVECGFFHKYGVDVEVVDVRNGPLIIQVLASAEVQVAYTMPSSVISASLGGMDIAFLAGLVNGPDGDLLSHLGSELEAI
jgi:ABC-type nitrate/sulfonate/bicarbonate transport system substrate-binding protein